MMLTSVLAHRYRLDAELGRGGMGVVYRAYDTVLDRAVAVKVISARELGTAGKAHLLYEARAAAKLNHPNIVSIYDAGEADPAPSSGAGGTPFIVMELVEGQTLWQRGSLALPEALRVARQVCAALEHAHANGIIHRDLKPENIVITKTQTAKLMDFGLARSLEGPRLTEEGAVVGTFSYLAPEILMGQEATALSDLYALGVLLYELATGQPPFTGDNLVSIISQHLYATVVPPSTHSPSIPPALETLILRLLNKQPADRPASATEVREALEQLDLTTPTAVETRHGASLLDRIVRGRLVARERELAEATTLWQKAVRGESGVLLVSGEPGIGKTRLVRELTTLAEFSRAAVLVSECYADGGAPYAPIAQIIQAALANSHTPTLPHLVLADLLTLAPSLRAQYPDVRPNPPLDPQAEQQRLFESVVALAAALTSHAPLLLVVDDAHWADGGTLFLARHLARRARLSKLPLLLVLTYREVELDEARALNEVLSDLNRERLATRLKLSRLTRDQTRDLLVAMFAEDITPDFLEGIYRETEGNPFFVEEVCKSLVEEGKLYREQGRWRRSSMDEIQVPQSVRVAIQGRIGKLPASAQDALRVAAILGREFDFETLHKASEQDEEALIDALEMAERAQLVGEVQGRGREIFSFAHALIPATLRESVSGVRRHRFHRRVAAAIESLRPGDFEALAYHYGEAGDEERARTYYRRAADRARTLYANEDALRCYTEALTLTPGDSPERFDLLAARAQVYDLVARREPQRADIEALLALAEKQNDDARRCEALIALADYHEETEPARMREPAERAAEIARALGDPIREGHALRRLGYEAFAGLELLKSRGLLEKAVARFREADLPAEAAASLHVLSLVVRDLGDLSAAQKAAEEAIALSRQAGDKRNEADGLRRLAIIFGFQYRHADALPLAEAALKIHREIGDRNAECLALVLLGDIQGWLRHLEEAVKFYRQAQEVASVVGYAPYNVRAVTEPVYLQFWPKGEYEAGLALLGDELARAQAAHQEAMISFVNWNRAFWLSILGQFGPALAAMQAAASGGQWLNQLLRAIGFSFMGRYHAELGEHEQALRLLESALEVAARTGVPRDAVWPLINQAHTALGRGDEASLRTGLEKAKGALELLAGAGADWIDASIEAYHLVTQLHLALGEPEAAFSTSAEVLRLADRMPFPPTPERYFFVHSRILRALGRGAEADEYLQKAHERVMLVASKTKDETLRRSWLENVRDNREVVREWESLKH